MPNTKSAARRSRSDVRKRAHNRNHKAIIRKVSTAYQELLAAGKKDEAAVALRAVASALDKAAKVGVIPKARANRKRSRLTLALNRLK